MFVSTSKVQIYKEMEKVSNYAYKKYGKGGHRNLIKSV